MSRIQIRIGDELVIDLTPKIAETIEQIEEAGHPEPEPPKVDLARVVKAWEWWDKVYILSQERLDRTGPEDRLAAFRAGAEWAAKQGGGE